jgi:multiple sugar transport system permease protein
VVSTATVARVRISRRRGSGLGSAALGRVFLAPSAVLMALVLLFPIGYAFVLSLGAYDGRDYEGFAGLGNYAEAVTSPRFWAAIRNTAVFTVTSVAVEFALGMAFALVMNQASRGRGATRAVILIPWVIPTVVAAQMWSILFNVQPGFVNSLLGLGSFNWLGREGWAMAAIVFADVWKTAPFVALLLLAGLQTIPGELYESAALDGAGAWRRFLHITLPLLRLAILVALLFRTVQALRVFDLPQVMTFGEFGTESLAILVQQYVVRTVDLGYGSALSTLTFIVVLGVGVLFVSALGRDAVLADRRG